MNLDPALDRQYREECAQRVAVALSKIYNEEAEDEAEGWCHYAKKAWTVERRNA